jgi:hypothetical protein
MVATTGKSSVHLVNWWREEGGSEVQQFSLISYILNNFSLFSSLKGKTLNRN